MASPQATPENPHRVPVPRLPGPWATTASSAPSTCRAASSPLCRVTASRSPPKAWPTRDGARQPAGLAQRGARCGRTRRAARRRPASRRRPAAGGPARPAGSPARTAGSAECRSATTTGIPPRSSASRSTSWMRRALLVGAQHAGLQRGVPGLDQVAGAGRVRRQPVRDAPRPARTRRCRGRGPGRWCSAGLGRPAPGGRSAAGRPAPASAPAGHCLPRAPGAPGHDAAERGNLATTPPDHSGRVASVTGGGEGAMSGGRPSGC